MTVEGFENVMDLKLVPYGNAREASLPDGSFEYTCQHGPAECDGNRILVCTQYIKSLDLCKERDGKSRLEGVRV